MGRKTALRCSSSDQAQIGEKTIWPFTQCLPQDGLNGDAPAAEEEAEAVSLDLTKKKKKKKKARAEELEDLEEPEEGNGAEAEGDGGRRHAGLPWDGTDRDYSYEELLGEFGALRLTGAGCVELPGKLVVMRTLQNCWTGTDHCYSCKELLGAPPGSLRARGSSGLCYESCCVCFVHTIFSNCTPRL